jgi:uncharacterized protein YdhG (YjbR/CyaY superfamily)
VAKTNFNSVDEYLASQPEALRSVLERVRATIRRALPMAEETISYQIPAYTLPQGAVIYFAGWKKHYSLYPATAPVVAALQNELVGYERSKGTIRFPLAQPVPVKLIERIAKLRAKEVRDRRKQSGKKVQPPG